MAYKQKTKSPLGHCWASIMHLQPWNKMRNRTAAAAGRGLGNKPSLKAAEKKRKSPFEKGTKGGGTTKVCLPLAKIRSMSKEERQKVINAKRAAGRAGKYKRSSKSNVSGTGSGGSLKTWLEQDWRQVANPSKKCGEK